MSIVVHGLLIRDNLTITVQVTLTDINGLTFT